MLLILSLYFNMVILVLFIHQGSRRREEVEYLDVSDSDDDAPTGGKVSMKRGRPPPIVAPGFPT